MIRCGLEAVGPEGYAAISIVPEDDMIAVRDYHVRTFGEYVSQIAAMAPDDSRVDPHDSLGSFSSVEIASLDGEPLDGLASEHSYIARCEVDLIATCHAH